MHRKCPTKHLNDGTIKEIVAEHGGIYGGGHQDNSNFWESLDHIPQDHQQEISLERGEEEGYKGRMCNHKSHSYLALPTLLIKL